MSNLEKYWRVYYDTKTPEARQQLLERSAEVVKVFIGRMRLFIGFNLTQNTLEEWGVQGLIRALDTYEWNRNLSFESYLKLCVKSALRLNCLCVLPKTLWDKSQRLEKQEVLSGDTSETDLQAYILTLWLDTDHTLSDKGAMTLKLAGLLELLSEQESLIFKLFYYDELTLTEISRVTGLTEDTILPIFSRTIFKLRIGLADYTQLLLV